MIFRYADNVSKEDRFDQINLTLDNGQVATLARGKSYDLTANELFRASKHIVLVPDTGVPAESASKLSYLPIVGTMTEGDAPVWSASQSAFVPIPLAAQSGFYASGNPVTAAANVTLSSNGIRGMRFVFAGPGLLKDVCVLPQAAGGNVRALVYDVGVQVPNWTYPGGGVAASTKRTLLWDSDAANAGVALVVTSPATGVPYQNLGSPNIPVRAGDQLEIAVQLSDSATARLIGFSGTTGAAGLPGSFLPVAGGAAPKLFWNAPSPGNAFVAAPQLTESQLSFNIGGYPLVLCRVG
jgi:hypothetical protein